MFFTALAHARGLGGHTGGAYDITPELLLADAFMRGNPRILPHYYDEAGHRVAIQYLMSVLNGHLRAESLLHYREAEWRLPGHPERGFTPGITFFLRAARPSVAVRERHRRTRAGQGVGAVWLGRLTAGRQ